jgi:hypothetical protein
LIYFAHQFKPEFIEAGLLADAEMLAEVTRINRQIHELAPVLNAGTSEVADVTTSDAAVPVEILVKRHGGALYIFAVAMRDGTTTVEFKVADPPGATTVEVLGEDRRLTASDGIFKDTFDRWAVHLYRIGSP